MATKKQPTKAEIAEENASLKAENAVLQEQATALTDKVQTMEELVADRLEAFQAQLDERAAAGEDIEPEMELYEDPYAGKHPHRIKAHPPGEVLSWKNPTYRAHRGWRGWVPVEHDDDVGRDLKKYLEDPPSKMEGSDKMDNKVRRGDSILCRIQEEIWLARQKQRTDRDNLRTKANSNERNREVMPGVTTFGTGQRSDGPGHGPQTSDARHRTTLMPNKD